MFFCVYLCNAFKPKGNFNCSEILNKIPVSVDFEEYRAKIECA